MESLLALARDAARESATLVRTYYGNALVSNKKDMSPVTEADTAVHDLILERLGATGIPILSEEDVEHLSLPYPERMWIIDPIDGTRGFISGTDDFAVMIGLIENGRPALGVVHRPIGDISYFATSGEGAYVDVAGSARRLTVSSRTIPELRGLVSISHAAPYMFDLVKKLDVAEHLSVGSVGIKAGYIAEDRADFYVTLGELGEWDVCAPELILTEAGGKVTDRSGDPLHYGNASARIQNGAVFTNGACHREVLTALHLATRTEE